MNNLEQYDNVKSFMQSGDLLLWKSRSCLGWLIRKFSRGNVNHAGLVLKLQEYDDLNNRRWTLEALSHGIELNLLSTRLASYDGEVWFYPLKAEFDKLRNKIGLWSLEKVGTPYDYGSLFKNALGRVSANANKLFCSEYAFLAYKKVGIVSGNKAPRPADMPSLGIFDKVVKIL